MSKKFLQVYVIPSSNHKIEIITSDKFPELSLTPINGMDAVLVVISQFEGAYLWELNINDEERSDGGHKLVKIKFSSFR